MLDRHTVRVQILSVATILWLASAQSTLAAVSAAPKSSPEVYTQADIGFISDFVCPETLQSKAEYDANLKEYWDWIKAHHPSWTVDQSLQFRVALLELHQCTESLDHIQQTSPAPPDPGVSESILPVSEQTKDCIRPEIRELTKVDEGLLDSARALRDKAEVDNSALQELHEKAQKGDHVAEFYMGSLYDPSVQPNVRTVVKDWSIATNWYMKAAVAGLPEAEYSIGNGYANGNGVKTSTEDAVHWYRLAGTHGYIAAAYNMALSYDEGIGVSIDKTIAEQWYCAAALIGDDQSRWYLVATYYQGKSDSRNMEKLRYWLGVLAQGGNQGAELLLKIFDGAKIV